MGLAVTTVASGGLPVKDLGGPGGLAVTEVIGGLAITKVAGAGGGLGVTFVSATGGPPVGTINSPTDLTGLIGWWDASVTASLNLTGPTVNSIADQSGQGRTITGGLNSFAKPSYSATGFNTTKPGILIDTAVGSAMETVAGFPMGNGNTLTWFCVATNGSGTSNVSARHISYAAPGQVDYQHIGSWTWACITNRSSPIAFYRNSIAHPVAGTALAAGNHIFMGTVASNGQVTNYIDGVKTVCQITPGNWVTGGTFAVGHQPTHQSGDTSAYITATFAEWGVATGYHNDTQIGQLYTYLKNKWGL